MSAGEAAHLSSAPSSATVDEIAGSIGATARRGPIPRGMKQRHKIAMLMLHNGTPRDREALCSSARPSPTPTSPSPTELGVFEIVLDADGQEQASQRVWDAVAASGTGDHLALLEHPDLPEHWRPRSRRPTG